MYHSRRVRAPPRDPDDAETLAETVRLGFASFRAWAGPAFDPPPAAIELPRIREGLERPSTWALLALSGGEPAGHVAMTQAREREEPRADIPGLAHLWMLFVRPPWWGSGLAARLNALAVERAAGARLRRDAPAHAGGERPCAGLLRARGLAAPTASRSPSRCSASTSWSTAAICEDHGAVLRRRGPPTPRRSPTAPRR